RRALVRLRQTVHRAHGLGATQQRLDARLVAAVRLAATDFADPIEHLNGLVVPPPLAVPHPPQTELIDVTQVAEMRGRKVYRELVVRAVRGSRLFQLAHLIYVILHGRSFVPAHGRRLSSGYGQCPRREAGAGTAPRSRGAATPSSHRPVCGGA